MEDKDQFMQQYSLCLLSQKIVDQGLHDQVSQPCVKIPELCFNIKTIFPDIGIPIIR